MKNLIYSIFSIIILVSCNSQSNSDDFIAKTSGRYLFNANEVLEIYFKETKMYAKWRRNNEIKLLKVNDSSFYMSELNEKIQFISKPEMHIELAPKTQHKGVKYYFTKMKEGEKTASEYFMEKDYKNALIAFKKIKKKDTLNVLIKEGELNNIGYDFIYQKKYDEAIEIFKINIELYPNSSNVYNSLGESLLYKKDTVNAVINFKKSLSINPENKRSEISLKKLTK